METLNEFLIPYTSIVDSSLPALEGINTLYETAIVYAEKFFTWLINLGVKALTKLGILKKAKTPENEMGAKQFPHLDKTFRLSKDIMLEISKGYMQIMKKTIIRSSKHAMLGLIADTVDQKTNAARAEVQIVSDIGNGVLYIGGVSFDKYISQCKAQIEYAKKCRDEIVDYYGKLASDNLSKIDQQNMTDLGAFNQSVTNYISFYTAFMNMILSAQ